MRSIASCATSHSATALLRPCACRRKRKKGLARSMLGQFLFGTASQSRGLVNFCERIQDLLR